MSTSEVAKKYVAMCNEGKHGEILDELFAKDAVSVEAGAPPGTDRTAKGLEAIHGKSKWWVRQPHGAQGRALRPYPHERPLRRAFPLRHHPQASGKRFVMDEVGVFTVKDDKIVKEEFFYRGAEQP